MAQTLVANARIDGGMHAVAESGQPRSAGLCLVDQLARHRVKREPLCSCAFQTRRNQLHAAGSGAAVLVADREHARGHGRGRRLPVAGRRQSRSGARGRSGPVIGDANEDRVQQAALAG